MRISDQALRGRTVIAADGRAVGQVAGITLEAAENGRSALATMQVELRREIADELGIEHRRFRNAMIEIPFGHVQSMGDAVILAIPVSLFRSLLASDEERPSPTQPAP